MRKWLLCALLVSTSAHASDKPLYRPAPDWVTAAPAIKPDEVGAQAPAIVRYDNQVRLQDGTVWTFLDTATRVATSQMLGQIGTIKLPWQPAHGDLIIHQLEIVRGDRHIDLVKGGDPFTVLRREQLIDQRELDGVLTATMAVEGLEVGDVLHLVFSTTQHDPTLKGNVQAVAPLVSAPNRAGFARVRLLWPDKDDIHWRAYSNGIDAKPVAHGGYKDLTIPLPLAKQPEIPEDAPLRFQKLPFLEASSFADWAAVARTMAPLYRTDGLIAPGSPLAAEVARIRAAATDPVERTALALQSVQDNIRYLLMGMDTGNYVPQTPAHTWDVRYGDCKAKTLLLLAMLHDLGIDAVPVVASSQLGGLVPDRLPGLTAFDHVFVRATIAGKDYWLDGTGAGARLADIGDVPPFGTVLPLTDAPTLVTLPRRPDARAETRIDLDLDNSAALKLPTLFRVKLQTHGANAEAVNVVANQAVGEQRDDFIRGVVGSVVGEAQIASSTLAYDPASATATIEATGVVMTKWQRDEDRWRQSLDGVIGAIDFTPDRARPEWRSIPVLGVRNISMARHVVVDLPEGGAGFALDGARELPAMLAGAALSRSVALTGDKVVLDERIDGLGTEIAPDQIPTVRAEVANAKSHLLRVSAPASYPGIYSDILRAKRAGKLGPYDAVYAQAIAHDPKEVTGYSSRAAYRAGVFDWQGAIEDYSKAIGIEPSLDLYLSRAAMYDNVGESALQRADIDAALALDPSSDDAIGSKIMFLSRNGAAQEAIALARQHVDRGGAQRSSYQQTLADVMGNAGDITGALAVLDAAIAKKPGDPGLLNERCWLKGTHEVALDTALKDCTKSIELSDNAYAALDSRALIYYRMGRYDDALADLAVVFDSGAEPMSSVFLRGLIRQKMGKAKEAAADFALVKIVAPTLPARYAQYGLRP